MKLHTQELLKLTRTKSADKTGGSQEHLSRSGRVLARPKRFDIEEMIEMTDAAFKKESPPKRRRFMLFHCDTCQKRFSSKQALDNHEKLHTNSRPHICAVCDKKFVTSSSLMTHSKLHDGTMNQLKCQYCDKKLNSASNLLRHTRAVHFEKR
jgi:DNA-directed RNA polymerase subunit RPC12/RpoP